VRPAAILFLLLIGSAAMAHAAESPPPPAPATAPAAPVQIPAPYNAPEYAALEGGRRLAYYCTGRSADGGPTILLEAGAGNDAAIWSKVQPALSASARVCSYDRAGYGRSDLDPGPRDAEHVLSDLRAALKAADIAPPYLLVGHSLGSYFMRQFATFYPDEVVGMVLVDPMIDGGHPPLMAIAPTYARFVVTVEASYERCLRPTARGEMRPGTAVYLSCGSPPMGTPQTDPKHAAAGLLEQAGMQPSADQVVAAERGFGPLPLVVLSRDPRLDGAQGWPPAEREAYRRMWTDGHRAIAALSTEGEEREVKGAGHGIHQDRPEAVIAAVEEVLARARAAMAARAGGIGLPASELPGEGRGPVATTDEVSR
jgi:pimeloyl-ACP methyl ester carboxylesterase